MKARKPPKFVSGFGIRPIIQLTRARPTKQTLVVGRSQPIKVATVKPKRNKRLLI